MNGASKSYVTGKLGIRSLDELLCEHPDLRQTDYVDWETGTQDQSSICYRPRFVTGPGQQVILFKAASIDEARHLVLQQNERRRIRLIAILQEEADQYRRRLALPIALIMPTEAQIRDAAARLREEDIISNDDGVIPPMEVYVLAAARYLADQLDNMVTHIVRETQQIGCGDLWRRTLNFVRAEHLNAVKHPPLTCPTCGMGHDMELIDGNYVCAACQGSFAPNAFFPGRDQYASCQPAIAAGGHLPSNR